MELFRYIVGLMSLEVQAHVLQRYQLKRKIGSGAYGHVWEVLQRATGAVRALKKNFDAFSNATDAQRTYRQVMFLRQLKHPNVVTLQTVIPARNDRDIYLVFEHMDVDLHTLIRQDGKTTTLHQRHKQFIIHQIAAALKYLHGCGLVHRDLKPSNVLVNENCEAKLCDFGLARLLEGDHFEEEILSEYIATRWYRAPELLLGCKDYSQSVDIWALGCLVGELFMGKPMFPGVSTLNQLERVVAWTGNPSSEETKHLGSIYAEVQKRIDVSKKVNRMEFLKNKVTSSCLDLISKLLQFDPKRRLTIDQVLKHPFLAEFEEENPVPSIKIHLHISQNTRLSSKEYRDLLYSEVAPKISKPSSLSSSMHSTVHSSFKHKDSKDGKQGKEGKSQSLIKKEIVRDKSRPKTTYSQQLERIVEKPIYTQPVEGSKTTLSPSIIFPQANKLVRKELKTSIDRKPTPEMPRKKGISVCSKAVSKAGSLNKKRELQTTESREMSKDVRKIKPQSRSCSEKQEKLKRPGPSETGAVRRVLLTDCYVNENIGRKAPQRH